MREKRREPRTEEERAVALRRCRMRISDWAIPGTAVFLDAENGQPEDAQPSGRGIDSATGRVLLSDGDKKELDAWYDEYMRETASPEDMEIWRNWKNKI